MPISLRRRAWASGHPLLLPKLPEIGHALAPWRLTPLTPKKGQISDHFDTQKKKECGGAYGRAQIPESPAPLAGMRCPAANQ
jgi:hypothetical protein